MNTFNNFFKRLFLYSPSTNYDFTLSESGNEDFNNLENPPSISLPNDTAIYPSLNDNLNYLKSKYNSLINSDIIFRPFQFKANGKTYNALFLGIDGMISSSLVNDFLLRPLINTNQNISTSKTNIKTNNGITMRKVKNFNLEDYIFDKLIPQNSISKVSNFEDVVMRISSGDCALFVDTLNLAFVVDVKGFESRGIDTPKNEIVIRGSQEAFVEKLRTNTSILRRIINSPEFIIEKSSVGKISNTNVAICYMKNIANPNLVAEVKYRLNNIDVDYVLSSRTSWTINTRW